MKKLKVLKLAIISYSAFRAFGAFSAESPTPIPTPTPVCRVEKGFAYECTYCPALPKQCKPLKVK